MFEEEMRSVNKQLLDEAGGKMMVVAVIDKNNRVVHYTCEYGDNEGVNHMREFIFDCVNERLVAPEELKIVRYQIDHDTKRVAPLVEV